MNLTDRQSKRIVANVAKVFREADTSYLNRQSYHLITQHMGFIAHYDLYGFTGTYADLRHFARRLQTSEYSDNPAYNDEWAGELDRRYREDPVRGCGQPPTVTAAIRGILAVARGQGKMIERVFAERERAADIATARALAAKHGLTVTD